MQPKFSVVMPVYNVEKYLRNSIQSILNQTISDYELILVDDGSPDNCPKICDEYAAQYPQVRVVHQKNVGLSSARNAGFAIAKGEFVYFPDSDDIIHPDTLDYFKRVIETVPNVKYIISDFQDVTEEEAFKAAGYDHGIEIYSRSQIQVLFLKRQIRILAPGSLLNINWYKDNNLTFENNPYGEDQLFIWKALLHVDEVVHKTFVQLPSPPWFDNDSIRCTENYKSISFLPRLAKSLSEVRECCSFCEEILAAVLGKRNTPLICQNYFIL